MAALTFWAGRLRARRPLPVALVGGAPGHVARHRGRVQRDDHLRAGAVGRHAAIDGLAAVRPIRRHHINPAGDLVEPRTDQRGITLLLGRQLWSEDLTRVGFNRQVEFLQRRRAVPPWPASWRRSPAVSPTPSAHHPAQRRIVGCPALHLVLGIRDPVTAVLIPLVRHRGARIQRGCLYRRLPFRPPPARPFCTNAGRYRSVQEMQGSTEAWMIDRSASGWPITIGSIAGMLTKDGVRILTRAGEAPPSEAT